MKNLHVFDVCSIDLQRKRKLLNTFDTEVTPLGHCTTDNRYYQFSCEVIIGKVWNFNSHTLFTNIIY